MEDCISSDEKNIDSKTLSGDKFIRNPLRRSSKSRKSVRQNQCSKTPKSPTCSDGKGKDEDDPLDCDEEEDDGVRGAGERQRSWSEGERS